MANGSAEKASTDDRTEGAVGVQDAGRKYGSEVRESDLPQELRHLNERERAQGLTLRRLFARQEHDLRESYARWIFRVLGTQMVVADLVFIAFAWAGSHWALDPAVIEVWLGATVVQVVGIVLIVTRHLFPNRDGIPAGP